MSRAAGVRTYYADGFAYLTVCAFYFKSAPRWRQRVLQLDVPFFAVVPTVNFAKQNSKTKGAVRRRFRRGANDVLLRLYEML